MPGDSYGTIESQSNSSHTGSIGRYYDAATGLQWNRARWYDPSTDRWMNQDPIGFAAGDANLYRYVGNGPTNGTNPSGLQSPRPGSGSAALMSDGSVRFESGNMDPGIRANMEAYGNAPTASFPMDLSARERELNRKPGLRNHSKKVLMISNSRWMSAA